MTDLRLVIFDCDGVLVDSERLTVRVNARFLNRHGWTISEDEAIARFVGKPENEVRDEMAANVVNLPVGWWQLLNDEYAEAFRDELAAVDGIHSALDEIQLLTCVASGGSADKMRVTLGVTDLWNRFDGRIYSSTDVARGKPAPDVFLHAADQMGVEPARCVVVEDSPLGVAAARAAGMHCFAFTGGYADRDALKGPGTTVFDHMSELPALIAARG